MANNYQTTDAYPSIRVLSATQVIETERVTILTIPSGIGATYEVPIASWQEDQGQALMSGLAGQLEELVANRHVTAGVPVQDFDAANLLQDYVQLTVTYVASPLVALSGQVNVPVDLFFYSSDLAEFQNFLPPNESNVTPDDLVAAEYVRLQSVA